MNYQVLDIIRGTTVDGPGFRTSIYLAGCSHHCPGCHNPQSWDPMEGKPMSLEEILKIVNEEDFDVTLSGGDPLFNPVSSKVLINALKDSGRNVWVYTGYKWEKLTDDPNLFDSIKRADVIVDGEYIEALKDTDLAFRGSKNQRIIDVPRSITEGKVIEIKR